MKNWREKAEPWGGDTWGERANAARVFLYIHGLLSDAENAKVKRRMDRQLIPTTNPPALRLRVSNGGAK